MKMIKVALIASLLLSSVFCAVIVGNDQSNTAKCYDFATVDGTKHCKLCQADYDEKLVPILTYGLQKRQDISDTAYNCFPNKKDDTYNCQFPRVEICEIYDNYGRCIRCQCDFGFKPISKSAKPHEMQCFENELRTKFCQEYNQDYQCVSCKWNQMFINNEDSANFYIKEHEKLDYGMFEGDKTCYDNTAAGAKIGNSGADPVLNCKKYNSKGECVECHSRVYDFWLNNEWDVNIQSSFPTDDTTRVDFLFPRQKYTKIHFDYWLSVSGSKRTCKRYPSAYGGLPLALKEFYLNEEAGQASFRKSMLVTAQDTLKTRCVNPASEGQEWALIFGNGFTVATAAGDITSDNDKDDKTWFLCAKPVADCVRYEVKPVWGNTLGSLHDGVVGTVLTSANNPLFRYYYAEKCLKCKTDFFPNAAGTACSKPDPVIANCLLVDASTGCQSCSGAFTRLQKDTSAKFSCFDIIANCLDHIIDPADATKAVCQKCIPTFSLKEDKKTCLSIPNLYKPQSDKYFEPGCIKHLNADVDQCATGVSGTTPADTMCDVANGFTLQDGYGTSQKRCGCTSVNSMGNQGYCVKDIADVNAPCKRWFNEGMNACLECNTGFHITKQGECIKGIPTTNTDKCLIRTTTQNCRLCDVGYFLAFEDFTCMADTDLKGCLYAKKKAGAATYECHGCRQGYNLLTTKNCGPPVVSCESNVDSTTGRCKCAAGEVQAMNTKSILECIIAVPDCHIYQEKKFSPTGECFQCNRVKGKQMGVSLTGKCELCVDPKALVLTVDGRWVCATKAPGCKIYQFDGTDYKCAECEDAAKYLTLTSTCETDCPAGSAKADRVWNGFYTVKGCIYPNADAKSLFKKDAADLECLIYAKVQGFDQTECILCTGFDNIDKADFSILAPVAADKKVYHCLKYDFTGTDKDNFVANFVQSLCRKIDKVAPGSAAADKANCEFYNDKDSLVTQFSQNRWPCITAGATGSDAKNDAAFLMDGTAPKCIQAGKAGNIGGQDRGLPIEGCASYYFPEQTTVGSTVAKVDKLNEGTNKATETCCRCMNGLQGYTSAGAKVSDKSCTIGFCPMVWVKGNCQRVIQKADKNECQKCMPGYVLFEDKDITKCKLASEIPATTSKRLENLSCIKYTGVKCLECMWPLFLINGECRWHKSNCYEYYDDGTCKKCEFAFFRNWAGDCVERPAFCNRVEGEKDITDLGTVAFTYKDIRDSHQAYDYLRTTCRSDSCLTDYKHFSGACYLGCERLVKKYSDEKRSYWPECCTCITATSPIFTKQTDKCVKCPANCLVCDSSGICTQCNVAQGYSKNAVKNECDKCTEVTTKPIARCTDFTSATECTCNNCVIASFFKSNGACEPRTNTDNCIGYEPNSDDCNKCIYDNAAKKHAFLSVIDAKKKCPLNTQLNCLEKDPNANKCNRCDIKYYRDKDGACIQIGSTEKLGNCEEFDHTDPLGTKCLRCVRSGAKNYGLSLDSSQCIENTDKVLHCWQYDDSDGKICGKCNNFTSPDQKYVEVEFDNEARTTVKKGYYVKIIGETDPKKQCQFLEYCISGEKTKKSDSADNIYRCTQCITKVAGATEVDDKYIALLAKKDFGKLESEASDVDNKPQCVDHEAKMTDKRVGNCIVYDKEESELKTRVGACIKCRAEYQPEKWEPKTAVAGSADKGGNICIYKNLFCRLKGCLLYYPGSKFEWLRCNNCFPEMGAQKFSLNTFSKQCDVLGVTNMDGGGLPTGGVSYTGLDGGINPAYDPQQDVVPKPPNTSGSITSIALETILLVIFGFIAIVL